MIKDLLIKHREAITIAGALVGFVSVGYGSYKVYFSDKEGGVLTKLQSVAVIGGGFFLLVSCIHNLK